MSEPATGGGDEESWPDPRTAWTTVAVLLLTYVFSFADRQILSLMVGPIKADLRISDTEFSLLAGASFALFYTILGLPFGRLADRYPRRVIIAAGAATWSLMTILCGATKTYAGLFLARVGVGVGEASLGPAAFSLLGDLFPVERRARAFAVYSLGIYIGAGLAFSLGGLIVGAVSAAPTITLPLVGSVASWHAVFLLLGLPGLILLPPLILSRPEPPRRGITRDQPSIGEAFGWARGRWRLFVPYFLGFGLMVLGGFGVLAWAPELFARNYGWQPREAGGAIGLTLAAAGSAGVLAGGVYTDRLIGRGRVDAVLIAGALSAAAGILPNIAFPLMPTAGGSLMVLALVFFTGAFASGAAPSALVPITPNALRGQMSALYLLVINLLGIGLGPTLPALLTDFVFLDEARLGWSLAVVGGVVSFLAAALLMAARAPYRRLLALGAEARRPRPPSPASPRPLPSAD